MLRKIRKFSKCGLDFVLHVMKGKPKYIFR